ncbi:MAG: NBR1-Ig-like domain-containing protein [Anaerolineae bacterium]|nr:NBR1-Ig-like domain-containing protein [Anaerolineae bacterium]
MSPMNTRNRAAIVLAMALLAGCNFPTQDSLPPPEEMPTAAALTVEAILTQEGGKSVQPEATQSTGSQKETLPAPSLTPNPAGGTATALLPDNAEFVSDITVPDYTSIDPGVTFTKTWRVRNSGESTWTTGYNLVFDQGSRMGAPDIIPIPREVRPGESVDLSIEFTAPAASGEYVSHWKLRNTAGELFGFGDDGEGTIFVIIVVGKGGAVPTLAGGATVVKATLSANKTSHSGACPVTLIFTGEFTVSGQGKFRYNLDVGSFSPGFNFTLSGPLSGTNPTSGNFTVSDIEYPFSVQSSVEGWARLWVNGANYLTSNQINFSVTCN